MLESPHLGGAGEEGAINNWIIVYHNILVDAREIFCYTVCHEYTNYFQGTEKAWANTQGACLYACVVTPCTS
jgi:hypothetical protein